MTNNSLSIVHHHYIFGGKEPWLRVLNSVCTLLRDTVEAAFYYFISFFSSINESFLSNFVDKTWTGNVFCFVIFWLEVPDYFSERNCQFSKSNN